MSVAPMHGDAPPGPPRGVRLTPLVMASQLGPPGAVEGAAAADAGGPPRRRGLDASAAPCACGVLPVASENISAVLARIQSVRELEGRAAWATGALGVPALAPRAGGVGGSVDDAAQARAQAQLRLPSVVMFRDLADFRARGATGATVGSEDADSVGGGAPLACAASVRRGHVSGDPLSTLGVSYRGLSVSSDNRDDDAARASVRRGRVASDAWNEDAFDFAVRLRPASAVDARARATHAREAALQAGVVCVDVTVGGGAGGGGADGGGVVRVPCARVRGAAAVLTRSACACSCRRRRRRRRGRWSRRCGASVSRRCLCAVSRPTARPRGSSRCAPTTRSWSLWRRRSS